MMIIITANSINRDIFKANHNHNGIDNNNNDKPGTTSAGETRWRSSSPSSAAWISGAISQTINKIA